MSRTTVNLIVRLPVSHRYGATRAEIEEATRERIRQALEAADLSADVVEAQVADFPALVRAI